MVLSAGLFEERDKRKLSPTEMRMLRLIYGKTPRDGISNEKIRGKTGVDSIEELLREQS